MMLSICRGLEIGAREPPRSSFGLVWKYPSWWYFGENLVLFSQSERWTACLALIYCTTCRVYSCNSESIWPFCEFFRKTCIWFRYLHVHPRLISDRKERHWLRGAPNGLQGYYPACKGCNFCVEVGPNYLHVHPRLISDRKTTEFSISFGYICELSFCM